MTTPILDAFDRLPTWAAYVILFVMAFGFGMLVMEFGIVPVESFGQ